MEEKGESGWVGGKGYSVGNSKCTWWTDRNENEVDDDQWKDARYRGWTLHGQ